MKKKTINKEISLSGVGVHSGMQVDLWLKPSFSGEIVFRRTDLEAAEFRIIPKNVDTKNSTTLVAGKEKIQTVEHLMAALYTFGIDSVIIELNGPEIPIMDGSAIPFVNAILEAGSRTLPERKKVIKIKKASVIREEESYIAFTPGSGLRVSYFIEYDHPAIRKQEFQLAVNTENFIKEIAPARTFGFLKDVPALRNQGLALGGTLDNAVILDEKDIINGPLRFSDEFVRHKILDFLGDLSLIGFPVIGHFKLYKAGHRLHLKMVNFLIDELEFWNYI